jgi:hypothetical protein
VAALTEALFDLLMNEKRLSDYRTQAEGHLLRHRKEAVARSYLQVFAAALQ